MSVVKILFWVSLVILIYTYLGYGIILYCIVNIKKLFIKNKKRFINNFQPSVVLIIPAYNEEDCIEVKIRNTLELEYPSDKLSVVFITDGSTDKTPFIIRKYPHFTLLHQSERKGKAAAMNRAIQAVKEQVVIFCDANTFLNKNCIGEITKHYADPKVGGVAGEKKIIPSADLRASLVGEGLYWKYESFLKKLDSEFYSVVGAAGELFSLRTNLYEPIQENIIIEDFVLSLKLCLKGYVIKYEPNAYAMETAAGSMKDEQKRKVRICAGAFQAMSMLKELFNVFKYPVLSFQYISHRILRWTLCPICLIMIFVTNFLLIIFGENDGFYIYFLIMQVIGYLLAITGWMFANKNIKLKAFYVPYYFLFMNIAVFMGFNRIITKKQSVLWEKTNRQKFS